MESISRNFGDLSPTERQVYETVLGHRLHAGQQIVVQLIDHNANKGDANKVPNKANPCSKPVQNEDDKSLLPEWCGVYRGLSDEEVEAIEDSILARSHTSRILDVDF